MPQLDAEINKLNLPFGWVKSSADTPDPRQFPATIWGWIVKVIGLLATALALSLGAPFWFDTLNKFVNLRGAGKPPEGKDSEPGNKTSSSQSPSPTT